MHKLLSQGKQKREREKDSENVCLQDREGGISVTAVRVCVRLQVVSGKKVDGTKLKAA